MENDIKKKLDAVQKRRLVAVLCRRVGHSRAWFYTVLTGRASILPDLAVLDDVLALPDEKAKPIDRLRLAACVEKRELARRLGITRQALDLWEKKPTEDRLRRVREALRVR